MILKIRKGFEVKTFMKKKPFTTLRHKGDVQRMMLCESGKPNYNIHKFSEKQHEYE